MNNIDTTTLAGRILVILAETNVTRMQLAKDAGVSKGLVTQWVNQDVQTINLDAARKIGRIHGYNPGWIMRGEGDKKGPDTTFKDAPRSHDLNRLLAELEDVETMGPQWAELAQAITMLVRKLKEAQRMARHDHLTPEMRTIIEKLCAIDKDDGETRTHVIEDVTVVLADRKPRSQRPPHKKAS